MASTTVFVPASTDVVVKGYTNASYLQKITVTPPAGSNGNQVVFQGSGEGNVPLGVAHFTTPTGDDLEVTVDVEYSTDGGNTWQSPALYSNLCSINAFQLYVTVAEDQVDEDYNDAICFVSWAEPGNTFVGVTGTDGVKRASPEPQAVGSTVVRLHGPIPSVDVRAYADAADSQQVTVTPAGQQPTTWAGQGFYDVALGSMTLPSAKADTDVTVAVAHSTDGGNTWNPSQVAQAMCEIGNYRLVVVASEDSTNDTWDDATTYFAWTIPTTGVAE